MSFVIAWIGYLIYLVGVRLTADTLIPFADPTYVALFVLVCHAPIYVALRSACRA